MAIASLALRTTDTTIGSTYWEIIAPSTIRVRMLELTIITGNNNGSAVGLGRPQAAGVGPVPVLFQQDDPDDPACLTACSLSWTSANPTIPLAFSRRWSANASSAYIGQGVTWTFPRGYIINPSATATLYQMHGNGSSFNDINCVIDE